MKFNERFETIITEMIPSFGQLKSLATKFSLFDAVGMLFNMLAKGDGSHPLLRKHPELNAIRDAYLNSETDGPEAEAQVKTFLDENPSVKDEMIKGAINMISMLPAEEIAMYIQMSLEDEPMDLDLHMGLENLINKYEQDNNGDELKSGLVDFLQTNKEKI